tara:strand:+ start:359 stop:817 length:459 start_codon:yes stop_codon:yes gene_type:complete
MDISRNQLDLMYLTNNITMEKIKHIKEKKIILKSEKDKYEKKIMKLIEKFMKDKDKSEHFMEDDLKMMFEEFLIKTVNYFKFISKEKKVQSQYDKKKQKKKKVNNIDLNELDVTIMRKPGKPKKKNLDSFIKKTKVKKKKKIVMPKKIDYES